MRSGRSPEPTSAPIRPVRRADAARNRRQVLDVARHQVTNGDLSLAMNTIAKLAGVGVGTVYRHFPTRQALLESIAVEAFDALVAEARRASEEKDPAVALRRLLRFALRLLLKDRSFAAVLGAPTYECVETLNRGAELGECLSGVLARARRARVIRPEISADDLRRLISAIGRALELTPDGAAKINLYVDVLLQGLRPSPHVR